MSVGCSSLSYGSAGPEADGRKGVPHLSRAVAEVCEGPGAELPLAVAAPALEGAVIEDCADMEGSGGD